MVKLYQCPHCKMISNTTANSCKKCNRPDIIKQAFGIDTKLILTEVV